MRKKFRILICLLIIIQMIIGLKSIAADNDHTYPQEDGTYYFIYVDEAHKISIDGEEVCGFIGIDDNGNLKYVPQDYIEMRNLLAKDYYVILRPSLSIDLLPMQLDVNLSRCSQYFGVVNK